MGLLESQLSAVLLVISQLSVNFDKYQLLLFAELDILDFKSISIKDFLKLL